MYFKGTLLSKLSEMIPGQIYLYAELDSEIGHRKLDDVALEDNLKDSDGNILYSFVFIRKTVWQKDTEYVCDLLEGPEGQSEFKLFESLDQDALDMGTAALYKLSEI